MTRSADPTTRATRDAANVAAAAVVCYAVLWLLSTQVRSIRAVSPVADDPWDAIATYAAIFLPFVAGATWIRSVRHREPSLPATTASRIRWGSGLAAGIVLVAAGSAAQAIVSLGFAPDAGAGSALLTALVGLSVVVAAGAIALTVRAAVIAGRRAPRPDADEPDVVDDLLGLASEAAHSVGDGRRVDRLASGIELFLDRSSVSPRRHRLLFGVALAIAAAVAFDVWHAIREGPWASAGVAVLFGILLAAGVLAAWLGTVIPLRILRPQPGRQVTRREG
jgi:ElaB/YqjD/DUF883 family membrane-anchored ribosome-binding protein